MSNADVQQMDAIFKRIQGLSQDRKNIKQVRSLTADIARLVKKVAQEHPDSSDHADALMMHCYALLWLSPMSKRLSVRTSTRKKAYQLDEQAVLIRLKGPHDSIAGSACYNLGIDLCVVENEPARAIVYLKKALAIKTRLPKSEAWRCVSSPYSASPNANAIWAIP